MSEGDGARVAGGATTGALGGAYTGAQVGAAIGGPMAPATALLGAIIGTIAGGAGGGLTAHAQNKSDDLGTWGAAATPAQMAPPEASMCPEGYEYDPQTGACVASKKTEQTISAMRGIKNKEGESAFDSMVKGIFTKKDNAPPVDAGAEP